MQGTRRRTLGVSLVEAMVALAVMAFGTLAVLGVQATLRLNADIAKQRGEAVRIAQEALETAREFETSGAYDALADTGWLPASTVYDTSNTVFGVRRTVVDAAAASPAEHPRRKSLVVDVQWADRTGQAQSVRLSAIIQGGVPALAGSLAIPADRSVLRRPGGRHPSIPRDVVPWGEDRSRFDPPGGDGIGWVFANATADITQICTGPTLATCIDVKARLLAGYVRFATAGAPPPDEDDARAPPGSVLDLPPIPPGPPVQVFVDQVAPFAQRVGCFAQTRDDSTVVYHCAVPVGDVGAWRGTSYVDSLQPAVGPLDASVDRFRVCRYTPFRDDREVGVGGMTNALHPLEYVGAAGALTNQNFLVIRAGDGGGNVYECPQDNDPNVFVTANTWFHPPAPPPP